MLLQQGLQRIKYSCLSCHKAVSLPQQYSSLAIKEFTPFLTFYIFKKKTIVNTVHCSWKHIRQACKNFPKI